MEEWKDYYDSDAHPQSERHEEKYPLCDKKWDLPTIPRDSEGYVTAFDCNQVQEFLQFFDEYGFVVIKNVLNQNQLNNTIDEIWTEIEGSHSSPTPTRAQELYVKGAELEKAGNYMESVEYYRKAFKLDPSLEDETVAQCVLKSYRPRVDRNDPSTWNNGSWPSAQAVGFLGLEVAVGSAAWENRQNENVYKVFSELMKRKDLWVSVDRYGIMRPTKSVPNVPLPPDQYRTSLPLDSSYEVCEKLGWTSISEWTHWDLNPWKWTTNNEGIEYVFNDFISENNGTGNDGQLKLQGLIVLADSGENDGGFCTVPGFHKKIAEWAKLTQETEFCKSNENKYDLVSVPEEDSLHQHLHKITARAGSLVIWRGEMAHCNYPNASSKFRMVQYLKMFPQRKGYPGVGERKRLVRNLLPPNVVLTELGHKLLGLENWN